MKKLFTLFTAVMLLCGLGANGQARKTWDFTKGVSEESRALLDADGGQWTKSVNAEGVSTGWATAKNVEGELTANGQVLKEFSGLNFSQFGSTNAVNYLVTKLRLQKPCAFTINGLTAGQKIVVKAQSANATATDRGLGFENMAIIEEGSSNTDGKILGRDAEGAPEGGITTFVLNVVDDGAVKFSTDCNGAPKSGIEILSIIIDEGDKNIKKWDFSNWSDATKAQVCAAEDWTTAESASKNYITGDEIRWLNEVNFDANNDLTAGGEAIKELKGLQHTGLAQYGLGLAFNYQELLDGNQNNGWGPYYGASYLWVMGAASTIVIPNVKAGSTLKLGVETHKYLPAGSSDARGFQVIVNGTEVGTTQKATAYQEFEYTIPADGDEYVNVTLQATKGCHLYFIEAEVKDETVVDKNPKLGTPKFDGIPVGKVNPSKVTGFTMTFPKSQNIEPATMIGIEGYFGPAKLGEGESAEDYYFDGVESTLTEGISFTFSDYIELQENSAYEFYITKLTVAGYEALNQEAKEGEKLYGFVFETSGQGIGEEREWNFTIDAAAAESIVASIANNYGTWAASSKGRYSYAAPITYKQLMIADETPFAPTAGLYFTMGTANDILIGTPAHKNADGTDNAGGNNGRLQLGGGSPLLIIPDCNAGDEVTIKALYADSKQGLITITNGINADTQENTIQTGKSAAEFKIIVTENGDLELASKLVVYQTIKVFPSTIEKQEINYTITAGNSEDLVTLAVLAEGVGETNDKIDVKFPYYLMSEEGVLYTAGTRGTEFKATFTLENEKNDYVLEYKKKNIEGMTKAVYVAEAEDIEGFLPFSADFNTSIRASKGAAGYNEADVTICTLPAGSYKLNVGVYDATKNGGVTVLNFEAGDWNEEVYSTGDNMSEVGTIFEAVVTEPTPLVLKAGGNDAGHGMDFIVVYEYDAEADGIANVETLAAKKNAGIFNLAGQKVAKNFRGIMISNGKKYIK